jgi:hypothetical protein
MTARNAEILSALVSELRALPATTPADRRAMFLAPSGGSSLFERFRIRWPGQSPLINESSLAVEQFLGQSTEDD